MSHHPRLIIITVLLTAFAAAGWWLGIFGGLPALGKLEIVMVGFLGVYFLLGLLNAVCGNWDNVRHIANALPAWGLPLTGLGLILAGSELHSNSSGALLEVFKNVLFSITPNIAGALGYSWLKTIAWWVAKEEV